MHKTTKDFSPEEIAEKITDALVAAFSYFLPHADRRGDGYRLAEAVAREHGFNLDMFHVNYMGDGVEYRHHKSIAFACDFDVRPSISWVDDKGAVVACQVSWGSGGSMDTTTALATASLHLEAATKACQTQVAMQDALRGLRGTTKADHEAWVRGADLWWKTNSAAKTKIWDTLQQRKETGAPK